jgi:hypothetical protein
MKGMKVDGNKLQKDVRNGRKKNNQRRRRGKMNDSR